MKSLPKWIVTNHLKKRELYVPVKLHDITIKFSNNVITIGQSNSIQFMRDSMSSSNKLKDYVNIKFCAPAWMQWDPSRLLTQIAFYKCLLCYKIWQTNCTFWRFKSFSISFKFVKKKNWKIPGFHIWWLMTIEKKNAIKIVWITAYWMISTWKSF